MSAKISRELDSRLRTLPPEDKIRALVLVATGVPTEAKSRRFSREERRATAGAMRQAADRALGAIDEILADHGGKRLAAGADSLGTIPVETTAAGIRALAEADQVRTILEDQKITRLSRPGVG